MFIFHISYYAGLGCILLTCAGCGVGKMIDKALPDNRADYRKSSELPPLEFPPTLDNRKIQDELLIPERPATVIATPPEYAEGRPPSLIAATQNVLPTSTTAELRKNETARWLVVQAEPAAAWEAVKGFWTAQGFKLDSEDAAIGILETEWKENRATIPQDGLRGLLDKVGGDSLYSANTRDRYRTRLERGAVAGTTEIYIAHRGAREVSQGDKFVWEARPTDIELEAEMLNRLLLHWNNNTATPTVATIPPAQPIQTAEKGEGGAEGQLPTLLISKDFNTVWRNIGIALDRLGITVENKDPERGIYVIQQATLRAEDWWLFSVDRKETQRYSVFISPENSETTRISILNPSGQLDTSPVGEQLLAQLQGEI